MNVIADYLCIPSEYLTWLSIRSPGNEGLDTLQWSSAGDRVMFGDGRTFALSVEVALFMEGMAERERLVHFGYVLHLIHLFDSENASLSDDLRLLHHAFVQTGRRTRNAGRLAAELCADVPELEEALSAERVCEFLRNSSLMTDLCCLWTLRRRRRIPMPWPLPLETFESRLKKALARLSREELTHWLCHGCAPPGKAAAKIAEEIGTRKPPSLAGVLSALARRQRLAGAVPYVAQLVSALALPPRRLHSEELAVGGYADLATHGHPEQVLFSQLALEPLEFLRRFAEHELLFFRREEPERRTSEDLVLLLDQGVRTWGIVRLVLSGAVFALGRAAAHKRLPCLFACTSNDGRLVDPVHTDAQVVGELLEASDLSPQPGLALERVLEERATVQRDIVLLTHPRNLAEPDIAAAARRVAPGTRLFAVAVDEHGAVQSSELRHGVPVTLARFRVELDRRTSVPPRPVPQDAWAGAPSPAWEGDVEPVGFPFRFNIQSAVKHLDFDHAGRWLLVGSGHGMLHAFRTDGSHMEVLPRGMVNGKVLTTTEAVLGVAGGFVVCGRLDGQLVAFHYDFTRRRCRAHLTKAPPNKVVLQWFYFRWLHCIAAVDAGRQFPEPDGVCWSLDLTTADHQAGLEETRRPRVDQACQEACCYLVPPPQVAIENVTSFQKLLEEAKSRHAAGMAIEVTPGLSKETTRTWWVSGSRPPAVPAPTKGLVMCLDASTGTIQMLGLDSEWAAWCPGDHDRPPLRSYSFTPQADGRPALRGESLGRAVCQMDVLAVTTSLYRKDRVKLRLFRVPDLVPIGEDWQKEWCRFTISSDGKFLVRQRGKEHLEIRDLELGIRLGITVKRRRKTRLAMHIVTEGLHVLAGRVYHEISWRGGSLQLRSTRGATLEVKPWLPTINQWKRGALPEGLQVGSREYELERFSAFGHRDGLVFAADPFGQVAVFDSSGKLVCQFFISQDEFAAWLPDGTRYGPPSITGGASTAGAAEKIGQALIAADRAAGSGLLSRTPPSRGDLK